MHLVTDSSMFFLMKVEISGVGAKGIRLLPNLTSLLLQSRDGVKANGCLGVWRPFAAGPSGA